MSRHTANRRSLGRLTSTPISALCLVMAGLVFTGSSTANAQDAAALKEGVSLLKRGQADAANKKFREILAADPSSETAYMMVKDTDPEAFLEMLKAGGQAEQIATRLLELAHVAEGQKMKDEAAIAGLVQTAINGGDIAKRTHAANKLAANHGEYAVPSLIGYLGSNDTQVRANAILALSRIGKDAVMPLAAALPLGSDTQKHNTAKLLQRIGDERAVPALLAASKGQGAGATAAAEAAAAHGGTMGAAESYVGMAKKYFIGDPQTLRNYDGANVVWSLRDGKLHGRDVPSFLYRYELAEQACYDALGIDAENASARAMIALVACQELSAYSHLSDEAKGSEMIASAGSALDGARAVAASTGTGDLLHALSMGRAMGAGGAVWHVCDALANVWDGRALDDSNALVDALTDDDKSVRYAAAVALLRIDPAKAFPKSNLVAQIAGQAASEVAIPQVLVIDSDSKNAMNVKRALHDSGYHAVVADSGAGGLITAKSTGAFDAVIVRDQLADITAFQVLDEINRDFRTANMVKVVMAKGGDVGDLAGDYQARNVQGFAPAAEDLKGLVNALMEAMPAAGSDAQKAHAAMLSAHASRAIGGARGAAFDLTAAQDGLLGATRDSAPEDVRLAALGALSRTANADAQGRLTAVLSNGGNSAAVRAAAAMAVGRAIRGQAPAKETFDALVEAMGGADVGVRTAAGGALGAAKLTADQQHQVLMKRRVD